MSGRQPTVQIWDIAMEKPIATFTGHKRGIQSLAFSPDSSLLASGGSDGVIYLWDITSYR
jgi:WD40 repeat protein